MALRFRTDMWHIKTEHTLMLRLLCSLASLNITVVSSKPGAHPMGERPPLVARQKVSKHSIAILTFAETFKEQR